ncbi:hypothetical protein RhiirA4_454719 [Rhizophagus irregularis]|uniref:Uncharacterized protein n=1 Tax=Rhizophagus irregularis TaxID=588596 RepID=A0A2I1G3G4_9GLOM|nr:hypothetical protein RhiirA4_454719 [Rhizophagus irregularis]
MNIPPPNETESPNNAPLLNDDETDSKTAKKTSWVWTYWDEETQEIKGKDISQDKDGAANM